MSGMKFRLQCSGCGATFFSQDRKTRYCPKCIKKGLVKQSSRGARTAEATGASPASPAPKPQRVATAAESKTPVQRPQKSTELSPELRERITQLYQEQYSGQELPWPEMIKQISDTLWVNRKLVSRAINEIQRPDGILTPELEQRAIEMYSKFVEEGERPPDGRRRMIAHELGLSYRQVRDIVYQWSQSQYAQSPSPELSREQRFEIEKTYWSELNQPRYHLHELPDKIAAQLGYTNAFQIARWLDTLHDDDRKFGRVVDVSPEIESQILEAYQRYLSSPAPPEKGLHSSIAGQIGGITSRQVHKVLQRFRKQRRAEYPL